MVIGAASASSSAWATGPMLPRGVESKVEQYLKRYWRAPARRSQASAARLWSTASAGSTLRVLSATTTASAPAAPEAAPSSASPSGGMPIASTVRIPFAVRVLARSEAPVKSSAMLPSSIDAPPCAVSIRWILRAAGGPPEQVRGQRSCRPFRRRPPPGAEHAGVVIVRRIAVGPVPVRQPLYRQRRELRHRAVGEGPGQRASDDGVDLPLARPAHEAVRRQRLVRRGELLEQAVPDHDHVDLGAQPLATGHEKALPVARMQARVELGRVAQPGD